MVRVPISLCPIFPIYHILNCRSMEPLTVASASAFSGVIMNQVSWAMVNRTELITRAERKLNSLRICKMQLVEALAVFLVKKWRSQMMMMSVRVSVVCSDIGKLGLVAETGDIYVLNEYLPVKRLVPWVDHEALESTVLSR